MSNFFRMGLRLLWMMMMPLSLLTCFDFRG